MKLWDKVFNRNTEPDSTATVGTTTYEYNQNVATNSLLEFFNNSASTETNSVVNRSVKILRNSISTLELELYERDSNGYGKRIHEYDGLQLITTKPNLYQSVPQVLSLLMYDVIMKGDGLVEIFRDRLDNPIELRVAKNYEIAKSTTENDLIYTIRDEYGKRDKASCDVIHIAYDSTDGITGRSLFLHASKVLGLSMSVDEYLDSYFKYGFFSNGYLTTDKDLKKGQFEQIKKAWEGFIGSGNVGKTPILDNGLKYQSIMVRPNETNVVQIKDQLIQDVAMFFGIPIGKYNLKGEVRVDKDENRKFYDETLLPFIKLIEQEFSNKLFKRPSQDKLFVRFNVRKFTFISSEESNSFATQIHNGILTPNEARKELNREPLSYGDELYLNYIPLSKTQEHFGENVKNTTKKEEDVDEKK